VATDRPARELRSLVSKVRRIIEHNLSPGGSTVSEVDSSAPHTEFKVQDSKHALSLPNGFKVSVSGTKL